MRHSTDKERMYVNSVLTFVLLAVGNLIGMFDWFFVVVAWFFGDGNGKSFLRDVVVVLIGIGFGIPAGLKLNRWWSASQDASRRKQLLAALKHTLKTNVDYLNRAVKELNLAALNVPSFPMDLTTLEGTSHVRAELLTGKLAEQIDKAFYELQHVDRRLAWLQSNVADPYEGRTYSVEDREHCERYLLRDSENYHQTREIADFIKNRTRIELTARLVILWEAKISTLILISGQTNSNQPIKIGGAIEHCQRAIDAIKEALGEPPDDEDKKKNATGSPETGSVPSGQPAVNSVVANSR